MKIQPVIIGMVVAALVICLSPGSVRGDNVIELLKSAERNYNAQNYIKALEDLDWIRNEISSLQVGVMKELLPDDLEGMIGEDIEGTAMLGMHSVSRRFRGDDGAQSVTITLNSSKSGTGGPGLGAFMGMAAAFAGMDPGRESKMVIQDGYRGQFTLETARKKGMLTFNLDRGGMVIIETNGYADESMARKAAGKLDLTKINESL